MQEVQTTLPIGTKLRDRYVVEGLLGKGGFGAVYLVKDLRVKGNLFALKEMVDSSKQERARFAFEGEVLKRLDHPALPRIYRVFEDDQNNRAYMLMDYIEGPNLETLRQKQPEKRFSLSQVLNILAPVIEAVSYLHSQNPPIIHRDIKPANIIVLADGNHTVLVDFGIAKEYDPDSTTTAVRRRSPGYGAPEQYSRGTNTRTDIYGLGATFYSLLTGFVPEDAFYRMTQLGSKGKDALEPVHLLVPTIPPLISDAIQKAMSISSNDRFATVEQFWQALNAYPTWQKPANPIIPVVSSNATTEVTPKSIEEVSTVSLHNQQSVQTPLPAPTPAVKTSTDTKKRRLLPLLLILAALAIGLGLAAAFWSYAGGHPAILPPASTAVVQHKANATAKPTTALTPTSTAGVSPTSTSHRAAPTAAPTAVPTTVPNPVPSSYPQVAGTHYGAVHNTNNGMNANMSAILYQNQSNGTLSGNVAIASPLQGSGSITYGVVQTNNTISFTVQGYNGNAPLFFYGSVNANGSMSGSYCSLDVTLNKCTPAAGGQGTWYLGASSGPTGSFFFFSSSSLQNYVKPKESNI
ncbi:MAG: hypothetical protein NVS4B7_08060 [Ktedonobacteraceae bacterium]